MKNLSVIFLFILTLVSSVVKSQDIDRHIFQPERLRTIQDTMTITGTVDTVTAEMDGDYHIRLRVDTGLIKLCHKNYTKQNGCLVLEIVCTHKSIISACKCDDYENKIAIPAIGQRITATGRFVYDRRHGWNEIHPVYRWVPVYILSLN